MDGRLGASKKPARSEQRREEKKQDSYEVSHYIIVKLGKRTILTNRPSFARPKARQKKAWRMPGFLRRDSPATAE